MEGERGIVLFHKSFIVVSRTLDISIIFQAPGRKKKIKETLL